MARPDPTRPEGAEASPSPRLREICREKPFWVLVLLGVVFFHRPVFFSEAFFYRDIFFLFAPQQALLSELWRAGEWPLWNPYLHGGLPLWADISNATLYPGSVLGLFFDPYRAITLNVAIHVIAAAAATYVLSRRLAHGRAAAIVAGAVFGYCGYTLAQVNTPGRLASMAYLPLMVLFWHLTLEERQGRWFLLTVLCGLLQVLIGAPVMTVLTFLTVLGWGLWGVESRWSGIRRAGLWLLMGLAVAALAAVQLLPLFELTGQSLRGQGIPWEEFGIWSLHPLRLPELVLPGFLGRDTLALEDYWGHRIVDGSFPYVVSLYFGPTVLGLALAGGLARPIPRRRAFLLALAGLGIVASLGRFLPGFETLFHVLPGIGIFRYPSKILLLSVLPVALLAAAGAERLFAPRSRRPGAVAVAWILSALGGALLLLLATSPALAERLELFYFGEARDSITSGLRAAVAHPLAFFLLATLVLHMSRGRGRRGRWVIAAIVIADLMLWGRQINPTAPLGVLTETPPIVEKVAEALVADRHSPGRLFRERASYQPFASPPPTDDVIWRHLWLRNVLGDYQGAAFRLPVVFHQDYHGLAPGRSVDMAFLVYRLPWERRLPLLSAAAVSALITAEPLELPGLELVAALQNRSTQTYYLYRNTRAAERAAVVSRWRVASSPEEAVREMLYPDFDPRRHAVLEEEVPARPQPGCTGGRVEAEASSPHRRQYRVSAECPGILVLSEVFYPGWRVRVDGEPAPLRRVNYAWSGVFLEPGEHRVEWRFFPSSVIWGAVCSALSALALGIAAWWRSRRKRDTPTGPPPGASPEGASSPPTKPSENVA